MKTIFNSAFLVILFTVMASAQGIYRKQGGMEMVFPTGSSATFESGSSLSIDAAATISVSETPTFSDLTVTYGVGAATGVFSGAVTAADLAATDDLDVGDDARIVGLATVGETLTVTGAQTLLGATRLGAAATASTHTAAGALDLHAGLSAATVASDATVSAGTTVTGGTGVIVTAGPMTLYSRTKAQLEGQTPTVVGQMYYCNDCATSKGIVVSTGTSMGEYAAADGSAFN